MAKRKAKTATRRPARSGGGRARAGETAHEKRIRKYLEKHPGATKRERRAKEEQRLTERERSAIRRYARQQAKRMGEDADDVYRDMLKTFGDPGGGDRFNGMKETRDRLSKRKARSYRRRIRKGVARFEGDMGVLQDNLNEIDDAVSEYDLPDSRWLWYR